MHISVLKEESLLPLLKNKGEIYVDATLGTGGHLKYLMECKPEARFFAFDVDKKAIENATSVFHKEIFEKKLTLVHENFSEIKNVLLKHGIEKLDGVIADLGFSSKQMDSQERGFSFQKEGPLDMRLNQDQDLTARNIVNEWEEKELARIFKEYGEERYHRRVARRIVEEREKKKIENTLELSKLICKVVPKGKRSAIHPATRCFQAIRIAVNRELDCLEEFLSQIPSILQPQGVLSIISFHSLEDRLVKNRFRYLSADCICPLEILRCDRCHRPEAKLWTKKPIVPKEEEVLSNPRSRSAKLRILEKISYS